MRINLFPRKEYTLESNYTVAQIVNELRINIMEPQKTNVTGLLPEIIAEKKGIRRYFEGVVNDHDFTINYKSYYSLTPSSGTVMSIIPQINGKITETGNGVEIKVAFEMFGASFISLMFTLPLIFFLPIIISVAVTSSESLFSIAITLAILYLCFVYWFGCYV